MKLTHEDKLVAVCIKRGLPAETVDTMQQKGSWDRFCDRVDRDEAAFLAHVEDTEIDIMVAEAAIQE